MDYLRLNLFLRFIYFQVLENVVACILMEELMCYDQL